MNVKNCTTCESMKAREGNPWLLFCKNLVVSACSRFPMEFYKSEVEHHGFSCGFYKEKEGMEESEK